MQFVTFIAMCALLAVAASTTPSKRRLRGKRASGVSEADQQVIVDLHNTFRSAVSPAATDMQKMVWDSKIAEGAQSWADNCDGGYHDTYPARNEQVGYGIAIGQNYAGGQQTWTGAVTGWHGEVADYTYGAPVSDEHFMKIGHYTAVVWGKAARVGCGYNDCNSSPRLICNYAFTNMGDLAYPYTSGKACADCGTCVNNLCDCNGLICKNGGTMDLKTCTCTCMATSSGKDCGEKVCPESDESGCASWNVAMCTNSYGAYVKPRCPYMCGDCSKTKRYEAEPQGVL